MQNQNNRFINLYSAAELSTINLNKRNKIFKHHQKPKQVGTSISYQEYTGSSFKNCDVATNPW